MDATGGLDAAAPLYTYPTDPVANPSNPGSVPAVLHSYLDQINQQLQTPAAAAAKPVAARPRSTTVTPRSAASAAWTAASAARAAAATRSASPSAVAQAAQTPAVSGKLATGSTIATEPIQEHRAVVTTLERLNASLADRLGPWPSPSLTSLTFASQALGFKSAAQSVTLTNLGQGTWTISSTTTSGDFSTSSGCTAPVAPGGTCTLNVTFRPTAIGARSGAVTLFDNTGLGVTVIGLTGTGTQVYNVYLPDVGR
jgi:hypothetical protein